MPEYLEDPSVLTKDKLKSELLAHNVELPSGNPTKDVYVQLYLKNLTAQNHKQVTATTLDAFSSDEELPPPVVSNRSRSSGRKATRKSDKVQPDELDVTLLTDQGLKDELLKHGLDVGPIVASTRKLYEKKLQKLLDNGPAQPLLPEVVPAEINVHHNGNSDPDLYSDKEDEVEATPEPELEPVAEPEPEPAPVVERPLRSRGKTPVTTRTRSSQHHTLMNEEGDDTDKPVLKVETRSWRSFNKVPQKEELGLHGSKPSQNLSHQQVALLNTALLEVEKIAASEQAAKVEEDDILKELVPNCLNSPTGITASCRRPIKGAADRPIKSSDLWNNENFDFSPKITKTTSSSSTYSESRIVNRVTGQPPSNSLNSPLATSSFSSSSISRPLSAAPTTDQTKATTRSTSMWKKLFLVAIVATFLFLVYQAMETNSASPFDAPDTEVASTV